MLNDIFPMKPNFKKLETEDFFINSSYSDGNTKKTDEKAFSDFIKSRKANRKTSKGKLVIATV